MNTNIGLWIDHRKAVIISPTAAGEDIKIIQSNAESHPGRNGSGQAGSPYEAQQVSSDDVQLRRFTAQLTRFYDEVADHIGSVDAVLIIGPGEAKGELQKHLVNALPEAWIVAEAADKMTDRQIAARVRDHFKEASPVIMMG